MTQNPTVPKNLIDCRCVSVAVIIPLYNRELTIERSIKSVQSQTFPVKEIIVVDDCSTDAGCTIVERMSDVDMRVKLIKLERQSGAPSARNKGAFLSDSEYLAFIDSDDVWHDNKLEMQIKYFLKYPNISCVGTWYDKVDSNNTVLTSQNQKEFITTNDLLYFNVFGPTSTIIVRSDIFRSIGGFEDGLPSCQDWDIVARLTELGPAYIVQETLTKQYIDAINRISSNPTRVVDGHKRMLSFMQSVAEKHSIKSYNARGRKSAALVDIMLKNDLFKAALWETIKAPSLRTLSKWIKINWLANRNKYY